MAGSPLKHSGYSGTPLERKLGYKEGITARLINQPEDYFKLFQRPLENIKFTGDVHPAKDLIHCFTKSAAALERLLPKLKNEISPDGCIWISWPKKASKVATDVTEDIIRHMALRNGLVDIKVCSVDSTWSGLKLVIPVRDREPRRVASTQKKRTTIQP